MKPRKLIALLIPALFALLQCHAMPAPKVADIYTASHLTMREGLSHNFVEDIFPRLQRIHMDRHLRFACPL